MILKITNQCAMACSHCLEDSRPKTDQHMTWETFEAALDCTERVESLARMAGYRMLLMSGGECTENPLFLKMLAEVEKRGLMPMIVSNGLWLNDQELRREILRPGRKLMVQVTNDKRFYPRLPPKVNDDRVLYVDSLTRMMPLGRFAGKKHAEVQTSKAPASFNIRSLTRNMKDIREAVAFIRIRAMTGMNGHCAPSISYDGSFMAGESTNCGKVGTVWSTTKELTDGLIGLKCNKCGLVDQLSYEQKQAIGEV